MAATWAATAQLKHDAQAVRMQRLGDPNQRIEALKTWLEVAKGQERFLNEYVSGKNCV